MIIEIISFGISTILFLILGLVMLTGRRDNLPKLMLAVAALASAIWSGSVTYQAAYGSTINTSYLLESTLLLECFARLPGSLFCWLCCVLPTNQLIRLISTLKSPSRV